MKCIDKTDKVIREEFLKDAFKELETQKTFINKHKKKVIFHLRRNGKRSGKQLRREFRELLHKQTCLEDEIASILEQKAKECVLFLLE